MSAEESDDPVLRGLAGLFQTAAISSDDLQRAAAGYAEIVERKTLPYWSDDTGQLAAVLGVEHHEEWALFDPRGSTAWPTIATVDEDYWAVWRRPEDDQCADDGDPGGRAGMVAAMAALVRLGTLTPELAARVEIPDRAFAA